MKARTAFLVAAAAVLAAAGPARREVLHASADRRPSHNGLYLAEAQQIAGGRWLVALQAPDGRKVKAARIHARAWMPEDAERHKRVRVTPLGNGVYRLQDVQLDQDGWWNLKLTIIADAGVDSVAFNVIVGQAD